jgi:hypothetical protein
MPLDILAEPLNSRGKIVQLEIQASDGPDLFMTLLHLDASFWWRHIPPPVPTETPTNFWGLNPKKMFNQWFWGRNHKIPWRSVSATPPPRYRHVSPSSLTARSPSPLAPSLDLVNRCLDLVNNVYSFACPLHYYRKDSVRRCYFFLRRAGWAAASVNQWQSHRRAPASVKD